MPRFDRARFALVIGTIVLCATALLSIDSPFASAAQNDDKSLSAFMRKKLEASSKILEGITTEDSKLAVEGADALLTMSKAEVWNVIADDDYREFNREFRASVRKLREAADKGNFDNATLQWMDAVKSCVECHKYVRNQRPAVKN